jgi:hypothetical protein
VRWEERAEPMAGGGHPTQKLVLTAVENSAETTPDVTTPKVVAADNSIHVANKRMVQRPLDDRELFAYFL